MPGALSNGANTTQFWTEESCQYPREFGIFWVSGTSRWICVHIGRAGGFEFNFGGFSRIWVTGLRTFSFEDSLQGSVNGNRKPLLLGSANIKRVHTAPDHVCGCAWSTVTEDPSGSSRVLRRQEASDLSRVFGSVTLINNVSAFQQF